MQGKTWVELFERIPEVYRDGFGIVTSSGTEINLQAILSLEEEFMVFRGRLMGSTEAQRTFFLPYSEINVLVYQRIMKDEDFRSWFGGAPVPVISAPVETKAEALAEEEAVEPVPAPEPAAQPGQRMDTAPMPHKAALLERIRKRAAAAPGTSAPGTTAKPPLK